MSLTLRRAALLLTLLLITLTLATCISAEEKDTVKYDPATDEFQMLMVLTDIRAKDADDLGYLAAIYANRDHLIAPGLPGGANVIGIFPFTFLRMGDKKVAAINIYGSRPTELESIDTAVPLDAIKIHPGTFFLQDKKLGYYQSITLSGKVMDAALVEISKGVQTEDISKVMQEELDRRTAGGKVVTWAQVNAEALKHIEIKAETPDPAPGANPAAVPAPATAPADEIEPQFALEAESLKALKQAITDKTLRLTRNKQSLTVTLPLTARDAAGVADLYKVALARMKEVVANTKETPELADQLQEARSALQVATALTVTAGNNGVTASLDLLLMAKAIASMPAKRIDNNDKDAKPEVDALKFLQGLNIPIFENITADQIAKDFADGTLKSYPSDKPVTPGTGIVAPKDPAGNLP